MFRANVTSLARWGFRSASRRCGAKSQKQTSHFGALLWMDKILHHFQTMGTHFLLVSTGESTHSKVSWAARNGFRNHPQYAFGFLFQSDTSRLVRLDKAQTKRTLRKTTATKSQWSKANRPDVTFLFSQFGLFFGKGPNRLTFKLWATEKLNKQPFSWNSGSDSNQLLACLWGRSVGSL